MFISVIIPTHNRSELLKDTLDSLSKLKYPIDNFEIIVIDNKSTDDTRLVVDNFLDDHPNCFYFREDRIGLHNARHCGLKKAKGDILAFIDDDVIVIPQWLNGVEKGFSMGCDVILVGGNDYPRIDSDLPVWFHDLWKTNEFGKFLSEYSLIEFGEVDKEISPYMVYGCNFSIRKSFVVEVGGFHPDGFPLDKLKYRGDGESHLSREIQMRNGKAMFIAEASLYHRVDSNRLSIDYLNKRSYSQGISFSYSLIREMGCLNMSNKIKINFKIIYGRMRAKLIRTEPFRSMRQSFFNGFSYHYNQVKSDSKLLEWVFSDNYFD